MVDSAWKYLFHNPMGNWNAGTANVLPAVLATWANLLGGAGNKTSYELYKEQARSYIDTARDNADLIKSQGEIALRNLQYKNKLEQGNDVVRIGASHTNMNGSNMEVLVRKEKIRRMNEATLKANYTNQVMLELANGYRQAGNTYGTLAARAKGDKYNALASILKGVETYVGLSVRDAKVQSNVKAGYNNVKYADALNKLDQMDRYGWANYDRVTNDFDTKGVVLNENVSPTFPATNPVDSANHEYTISFN